MSLTTQTPIVNFDDFSLTKEQSGEIQFLGVFTSLIIILAFENSYRVKVSAFKVFFLGKYVLCSLQCNTAANAVVRFFTFI